MPYKRSLGMVYGMICTGNSIHTSIHQSLHPNQHRVTSMSGNYEILKSKKRIRTRGRVAFDVFPQALSRNFSLLYIRSHSHPSNVEVSPYPQLYHIKSRRSSQVMPKSCKHDGCRLHMGTNTVSVQLPRLRLLPEHTPYHMARHLCFLRVPVFPSHPDHVPPTRVAVQRHVDTYQQRITRT